MNTYATFLIAALVLIAKPFAADANSPLHTEFCAKHQSTPTTGKITILSNNLSGDSVSVAHTNNHYSVILTKRHDDGNLDLNLDQIEVNNASGKSVSEKVVINILSFSQFEINLSALPAGVYMIKTKTGSVTVEKK